MTTLIEWAEWRAEWDESKHPRQPDGKFGNKPPITGGDLWESGQGVSPPLSENDRRDIGRIWYGHGYLQSTRHLRQKHPVLSNSRAAMEKLQAKIVEAKLTVDVEVYRGIKGGDRIFGPTPGTYVGKSFTDPSFTSTSANAALAQRYGGENEPLIHVKVPAGFSMLRADPGFFNSEEDADRHQEFTLPAGTTFKIADDTVGSDGKRHVYLEVTRQKATL